MKASIFDFLFCAFGCWQLTAQPMPFRNLGFDEANTNNVSYSQPPYVDGAGRGSFPRGSGTTADLLPGWQVFDGASNPVLSLGFNDLGGFATPSTILGRETSFLGYPVEGQYGILMAAGADGSSRSLVQRGDVPMDRPVLRSSYVGSPGSLKIDGQPISRLDRGFAGSELKQAYFDLTQFAGRNVELQLVFTSHPFIGAESGFLDSLEFVIPAAIPFTADFNRDGNADLLFQDAEGFVGVWFMNVTNLQSASFLSPANVYDNRWRMVGLGEFDPFALGAAGREDLLFQHEDGTLAVWYMERTNQFRAEFLDPIKPAEAGWHAVATADFNKDGKIDIVFQKDDGALAVWYMDRAKMVDSGYFNPARPSEEGWNVVGAADINSDGKPDLVFQHDDGTLAVWYLDGLALKEGALFSPAHPGDKAWRVVSVLDLDLDRKADLVFQHEGDGTLAVWLMDGIKLSAAQLMNPAQPGGTWKVVAP